MTRSGFMASAIATKLAVGTFAPRKMVSQPSVFNPSANMRRPSICQLSATQPRRARQETRATGSVKLRHPRHHALHNRRRHVFVRLIGNALPVQFSDVVDAFGENFRINGFHRQPLRHKGVDQSDGLFLIARHKRSKIRFPALMRSGVW